MLIKIIYLLIILYHSFAVVGFTSKTPDAKFHGNHRHFFARPMADYVDLVNLAREQGTKNSRGQTPFLHFVEVQMTLVKKLCSERGIDLTAVFADHDKAAKGRFLHPPTIH